MLPERSPFVSPCRPGVVAERPRVSLDFHREVTAPCRAGKGGMNASAKSSFSPGKAYCLLAPLPRVRPAAACPAFGPWSGNVIQKRPGARQ